MNVLSTFAFFFSKCLCSFTLILHVLELLNLYHWNYNAFILWAYAIRVGQLYTPATEYLREVEGGGINLQEEAVILTLVSVVSVCGCLAPWFRGLWSGRTSWWGTLVQKSNADNLLLSGERRETGGGARDRLYPLCFCLPEPASLPRPSSWSFHCLPSSL